MYDMGVIQDTKNSSTANIYLETAHIKLAKSK